MPWQASKSEQMRSTCFKSCLNYKDWYFLRWTCHSGEHDGVKWCQKTPKQSIYIPDTMCENVNQHKIKTSDISQKIKFTGKKLSICEGRRQLYKDKKKKKPLLATLATAELTSSACHQVQNKLYRSRVRLPRSACQINHFVSFRYKNYEPWSSVPPDVFQTLVSVIEEN